MLPSKIQAAALSEDGFVETLAFNTALIRRRIRTPQFTIEMMSAGNHRRRRVIHQKNYAAL